MSEKRRLERFPLSVPARVMVLNIGENRHLHARTRDLSASGAYLFLRQSMPQVGTDVELEIDLTVDAHRSVLPMPRETCVRGRGTITRREADGLAVAFAGQLQFA
ncbi:MAG: PilZ domain-containing protein [Spirochaetaceae bacterium]|nr:PilZ domain-containing protein [Spirochaetaceae bacterium]